jgi:hypothetical protein
MHFVTALEYMVAMEEKAVQTDADWCHTTRAEQDESPSSPVLPPPVSRKIINDTSLPYDGIFFGYPIDSSSNRSSPWRMNPIRCRTTFEPKFSGDLSEIVVSGTMGEDLDPTLPKSQYYYNHGWTLDLSEAEKTAKKKLNTYPNGLGFTDSKEAYYGIYESPPVALLLPYEAADGSFAEPKTGDPANDWYESIVVCQVNDKNTFDSAFKDPDSCDLWSDVGVRIGGFEVAQNATKMLKTIGSVYLGKPICKHVLIPEGAKLTSHNTLVREGNKGGDKDSSSSRTVMAGDGYSGDSRLLDTDQTGLLVEVFVSNPHIVHVNQACSLSHVIWEERSSATTQAATNER